MLFTNLHVICVHTDYVGYTARHLHQHIAEHKYSAISKHFLEAQGDKNLLNDGQFRVHKKCHGKFDCLIYEMLLIPQVKKKQETIILLLLCNYDVSNMKMAGRG